MKQSLTTRLPKVLAIIFTIILVYLPFHEFLTTWIGVNLGHLSLLRGWKEVIILASVAPITYLVVVNKRLKQWLMRDPIVLLIIVYVTLLLVVGSWSNQAGRVSNFALLDGIMIDARFLIFFVFTLIVTTHTNFIKTHWQKIIIWPGVTVVLLGLSQLFLPINFLSHFGYGAHTIPGYSTVDQSLQYRRIQSTLRGANPLGAYLVLVIPALIIGIRKKLFSRSLAIFLSLIALYYTYSRSAYIGLAITLIVLLYLGAKTTRNRQIYWGLVGLVIAFAGILIIGFRHNPKVENVFFHTDTSSRAMTSSNAQRTSALETGIRQVRSQPLGDGPGTAGPASEHNKYPARIAENYYIQIAQEVGWFGLAVFVLINALVGLRLWQNRKDPLSGLLFATLIGLTFVNFVSHAWADDTLSLIWWGIAGVALAPAIINEHKSIKNGTNKKTARKTS